MKKIIFILAILTCLASTGFAADVKVSALPEATAVTSDDLIMIVDDPGGTPVSKRITAGNFKSIPTIDGSAAATLTAAQMSGNGCIVTNYGQTTADVRITLPAAAAGLSALFTVATAQSNHWGALAGANDKFYLIAAAGTVAAGSDAAAVVMVAAQLGQAFAVWSFQSGNGTWDWMVKAVSIGTSTFEAHAAF